MKSTFVLQIDEKSYCKYCGKNVELLCHDMITVHGTRPMFYICFDCRKVFEVGKGEVPRE